MGKRRLIKLYESRESNGIYLNRFPNLDNGRRGTYHELSCDVDKEVICPVYDFTIHDRAEETVTIKPARVIIVEGILIFENKELCDLMDIKIYVDTDADVRILRRIIRDVRDRGRSLESVIGQYLETVKPMHEQFVEPSKKNADVIIPEGGHNLVALEMVIQRVKAHLAGEGEEKD